jgi:hypothetical protein
MSPYIMRYVERFNGETWEEVAELPHPMEYLSAMGFQGKVWIASPEFYDI